LRVVLSESNRYLRVQAIDDVAGHTLLASSTQDFVEENNNFSRKNKDCAKKLGEFFAEKLKKAGQKAIIFDRNGRPYRGKKKTAQSLPKKSNNLEKEKVIELAEGQLVDAKEVKKEKTISEVTNRPESTKGKNGSGLLTNRKNGIFTSLALIKDEEKKGVAYAHMGGKEPMKASAKAF
ncbi:36279_t:CDS:2, partial [Racocetra persica]